MFVSSLFRTRSSIFCYVFRIYLLLFKRFIRYAEQFGEPRPYNVWTKHYTIRRRPYPLIKNIRWPICNHDVLSVRYRFRFKFIFSSWFHSAFFSFFFLSNYSSIGRCARIDLIKPTPRGGWIFAVVRPGRI